MFEIVHDENFELMTKHKFKFFVKKINFFLKFVCSVIVWVNPLSKLMQTINFGINTAMQILETLLLTYLKKQQI